MMEGWKKYTLGEIVDLKQGFVLNKKSNHYLAKEEKGFPLLKISDLKNGTETLFVKHNIPKQFIVTPSEIIYSRTGQVGLAFMGKTGVVYNNCFKVIPKEMVYSVFLYQWLNTSFIRTTISSLATGAAQPDLNHGAFKSVKINLPPLKTQRKIASILSGYDDLIENNLKRIKLLEEQAQQTYEEWFVRFKFPGCENVEVDEVSGLPFGWEKKKIMDLGISMIDGDRGKNYPKQSDFFDKEFCLFLNTGNVTSSGLNFKSLKFITKEKDLLLRKGKLVDDDIIITTRGTIGNIAYFRKEIPFSNVRINSGMLILRSISEDVLSNYIYQVFISGLFQRKVRLYSYGAAQPQLPVGTLKNIKIIIPDLKIQTKFSMHIEGVLSLCNNLRNQNQLLKEARDILLPRLMSGIIDV